MKNNLNSLNDYLFEQLERLNDDEELEKDGVLEKELKRAKAITGVSTAIVNNAKLILDAKKYADEQAADVELYKRKKDAEAKKYEAEQEAEARKAQADADKYAKSQEAEGIRLVGEAEAEAIRAKAVAEAEGIEKKAEAMQKMGEAAVLEMFFNMYPLAMEAAAKPLSNVDQIMMFGEGNSAKLVGDIVNSSKQVIEGIKNSLGIDPMALLAGFAGGKLGSKSEKSSVTVEPVTTSDDTEESKS